ncbi:phospholipid phosphatase [Microbacterium sp. CH12i]|uniref:phosphatase PAP2 family protein n=1 Tax=Microbacterium sp. CH12i TaxID=1479651 RepID=UPI000461FDA9|nr:phosphatase PAP2 family protein [Microbacterium sp. CH12i]KDA04997.1 phospholipid phosphatase [Microbacterium sp. CH12i]
MVLVGLSIVLLADQLPAVDSWWHSLMLASRTDAGLAIARALAVIGGVMWMIIIGLLLIVTLLSVRSPWSALTAAAAMLASETITAVMKVGFARQRPPDSLTETGFTSFPSGHTTLAAAVAITIALLAGRKASWILAAAWIVLMAWSRTYLAAHWLTDTLCGAVLGASVALLMWVAVQKLASSAERRRSLREHSSMDASTAGER